MNLLIFALLLQFCIASPADAHPAPYSYVDLTYEETQIQGSIRVHANEIAKEIEIDEPQTLLDETVLAGQHSAVEAYLLQAVTLKDGEGARLEIEPLEMQVLAEDGALQLNFAVNSPPPARLDVEVDLFSQNQAHATFVNIYEAGELAEQFLFGSNGSPQTHYAGSVAGAFAVFETFVPSGAHHVVIGLDHVAFVIGLILLGGSFRRLTLIVSAFTIGHSITLALATLDIFTPPAWIIEPLIALSIVIVGLDNLMRGEERDLRTLFAGLFGLVHGFGFAFVFAQTGLSQDNLIWPLLAFNLGVELGQLAIVIPIAGLLILLRKRLPKLANRISVIGSLAIIVAGIYWFVDRVLLMASG